MSDLFGGDLPPTTGRNKRRAGATLPRHTCPGCGATTRRRVRRMPNLGVIDARCQRCAKELNAWPEQSTDRTRPDHLEVKDHG